MNGEWVEAVLVEDAAAREQALATVTAAREHERSAFAGSLMTIAKAAADQLAQEMADGSPTSLRLTRFERSVRALSLLRVEVAKSCLLRIADEGSRSVKSALAHALQDTKTAEGRAVLVHLLSDDEARMEAILTIGVSPWPEVLPLLIEVAEADDQAARVAARAIAKCGAVSGPNEALAAADFLLELLDDEVLLTPAADALLRYGKTFPSIGARVTQLAREPGRRKVIGLLLAAMFAFGSPNDDAALEALAKEGAPVDEPIARAFLRPLLKDPDREVSDAALRTWRALHFHLSDGE